jgi:hypothetical protein
LSSSAPNTVGRASRGRCSRNIVALFALTISLLLFTHASLAAELRVDCSKSSGTIRPLQGVNSGPLNYGGTVDLSAYHRDLKIPYTRLHDCHWPNPDVVDVHCIFPDFRADPESPASYQFSRTDEYVQSIVAAGSGIVYRLGESIEHTPKKYFVHPPADFDRWTRVCLGIIAHYNHGWAEGFHHDIRYWEIWNEPENQPAMWTGTNDDYYRLYRTAAKAIKAKFPTVKVGGPAVGFSGEMHGDTLKPSDFVVGFLEMCKRESLPLDFFSWHAYTPDPDATAARAKAIRRLLDQYGFTKTESHLNEWNYLPRDDWSPMLVAGQGIKRERFYDEVGGPAGAAYTASVLLRLQDAQVDVANYYTGEIQGFGLFNFHGVPKKTFYATKAFRLLADLPQRLSIGGDGQGPFTAAASTNRDRSEIAVLVVNFNSSQQAVDLRLDNLPWKGAATADVHLVDARSDLALVRSQRLSATDCRIQQPLAAPSVMLVKLKPAP